MRLAALWTVNDKADVLFNLTTQNDTTHGDWLSDPYLGDAKITRFIDEFPPRQLVAGGGDGRRPTWGLRSSSPRPLISSGT